MPVNAQCSFFDNINDWVVKSERGELVGGSDAPLVCSPNAVADDVWREPITLKLH